MVVAQEPSAESAESHRQVTDKNPPATFAEQLQALKVRLQKKIQTTFEDSFSEEVWITTYKDHNDQDINDTLFRVAAAAASVEATDELKLEWTEKFYDLLSSFKATAGGRIYANAGTEWGGTTLMNCYVGPRVEADPDSLNGIFEHLRAQAHTLKSEGGWGENFSYLRPRGTFINGIGVETPGAVKYMELFDKTSDIITAGSGRKSDNKRAKGKIRKGAMMGVMDVWHPDIVEFITAKQNPGRLTKFNISVNCTDEFMNRIVRILEIEKQLADEMNFDKPNKELTEQLVGERTELDKWDLIFPDTTFPKYKKEWTGDIKTWKAKGHPIVVHNTVSAMWLWNLIMESTYNRAEPGVLFLDRANYFLPLNYAETVYATNPCGEQTLAPGGVCNLGSLNLTQFVSEDHKEFDLKKIEKYTRKLVRFLDNINNLTKAPLPEYEYSIRKKRRIGVGILGWGSALYMLKTRFASPEANKLRDEVMGMIARTAYMASIDLAEEKGMFEYCDPKKHVEGPFVKSLDLPKRYMEKLATTGIRNSSLLSIQPTGNTSILANVVSGGLEPVFLHDYIRTAIVGYMPKEIADVTPKWFEGEWFETKMFKFTKEGDEEILKGKNVDGTVYKIDKNRGLTKEVSCEDYGVRYMKRIGEWDGRYAWTATALSMEVADHVNDLTGFARWVDSAMSKTVNVPHDYSFDDFANIYLAAYKSGYVKGVTTYRSGTMTTVLSPKEEMYAGPRDEEIILQDVRLPDSAPATMKTLKAEGRKWYLTVIWNERQTRPLAFFVHTNSHEKGITTTDAIDALIKLARKKGIPKKHIDVAVEKMSVDNNPTKIARAISLNLRHGVLIKNIVATLDKVEGAHIGSFLFQIKKFLSSYIKDGEKVQDATCEGCGSSNIVYQEGCMKCISCGSSRCG
jgi:ribonucleoside-diphosphate reductase alpha chain